MKWWLSEIMSSVQLTPVMPASLTPKLVSLLRSADPAQQLLAILALLRRTHPLAVQVSEAGQPLSSVKLAALMKATAQRFKAAEGQIPSQCTHFGFRVKGKLPKKVVIGGKLRIEAEIIDRQGKVCVLPASSLCRLALCPDSEAPDLSHRAKRLREDCLCGSLEVQTTGPTVLFEAVYFAQASNQQLDGVFTLQLECEGVASLQLPGIRVTRS